MEGRNEKRRSALFSGKMDMEDMENVLALYRDLFQLNEMDPPLDRPPRELAEKEVRMRLAEGFTLVDPEEILPDGPELAIRIRDVLKILQRHSEDPDSLTGDLKDLIDQPGRLDLLVGTFLREGEESVRKSLASMKDVNPEVAIFVLFNALKVPFLGAARRCRGIDTTAWEKGSCPVCGGEPAVACLIGEGGKRFLICFRCETRWRYRRMACPYCGHEDPKESVFLYSEDADHGALSASVCGQCLSYIKGWRVEGEDPGELCPEIEDLKTPGFDRAVQEEGYLRGAPNVFGLWIGSPDEEAPDRD